jgi:hypothetical protein
MARLASLGIESWRVDLLPLAHSNAEHLAQYSLMDISLDPFPYAGDAAASAAVSMRASACRTAARTAPQAVMQHLMAAPAPAGTTTTAESMYMGVPCITLLGACHAHNVGASLLGAVGLADDWVAGSQEQYIDLAVRWASNVQVCHHLGRAAGLDAERTWIDAYSTAAGISCAAAEVAGVTGQLPKQQASHVRMLLCS